MYFHPTDPLRALLNFDTSTRDAERKKIKQEDHSYQRLNIEDRAPCPGLNALCNQGFLPRDGKNITLPRLEAALMEALHMTGTVAHTLALQLKPVLRKDGTFDLIDARTHNVVEHDRSMTRLDFRHGDNYTMQPQMFSKMLNDANGEDLTIRTMAKSYIRREREHRESGGQPHSPRMWFVSLLITVGFINAEATGHPTPEAARIFYKEERLEDRILANPTPRSLHGLLWKAVLLVFHILVFKLSAFFNV